MTLCRLVSISVLFLLFIFIFGLPSLKKYQAGGLTVEHSTVRSGEGNLLPGITVCPYHAELRTAWRNATATMEKPEDILAKECNLTTARQMLACIEEKTYSNVGQMVYGVLDGRDPNTTDFSWRSVYSGGVRGTCHKLTYPHPIGTNHQKDAFVIKLNPNISYDIFLHDPVFFWPTVNPSAIPNAKISIDEGTEGAGMQLLFLEVTKHNKLNIPSSPCVSTFSDCFTTFMTDHYIANTSTTDELLKVELLLTDMAFASTSELEEITGCQNPCEFMEYKLVGGKPDTILEDHGFMLTFTSNDMTVLIEVKIPNIKTNLHTSDAHPSHKCVNPNHILKIL